MSQIRLDKYLSEMGLGTRSQVKLIVRDSLIKINGEIVRKSDIKIDPDKDEVLYNNTIIEYAAVEYYMLNKPAGCVSATKDNVHMTILDYITTNLRKDLFPVGRLDLDTEGLLLVTNDGDMAHRLLSPRKHVDKTYYALIDDTISSADIKLFEHGMDIGEDSLTLPAKLKVIEEKQPTPEELLLYNTDTQIISVVEITIHEGKFHQVKRMFESISKNVLYLKRISMGPISLDPTLAPGEYRSLTPEEIELLKK
jgi:16S rRNA pseudouridine516 synthase